MTWVTVLLLLLLASLIYLGFVWIPVYILNYEVKGVVHDYANRSVKNKNDAALCEKMAHKIRTLQEVEVALPDGGTEKQPVIDVRCENVIWERDEDPDMPTLHVAFEYERIVHYPIFDVDVSKTMTIDEVFDISKPDWGPSR